MTKKKYFLTKQKYFDYLYLIDSSRDNLVDLIKDLLKDENSVIYPENLSLLCETVGILYHLENVLDDMIEKSTFDKATAAWHVEKKEGLKFLIYFEAFFTTKETLLKNNISFSIH